MAHGSMLLGGLDTATFPLSLGIVSVVARLDLDGVSVIGGCLLATSLPQLLVGHGSPSFHQTADEAPEDQATVARVSTVEAKDELVEVGVQVLVAYRPLMGPEQPAFQERSHAVNVGVNEVRSGPGL